MTESERHTTGQSTRDTCTVLRRARAPPSTAEPEADCQTHKCQERYIIPRLCEKRCFRVYARLETQRSAALPRQDLSDMYIDLSLGVTHDSTATTASEPNAASPPLLRIPASGFIRSMGLTARPSGKHKKCTHQGAFSGRAKSSACLRKSRCEVHLCESSSSRHRCTAAAARLPCPGWCAAGTAESSPLWVGPRSRSVPLLPRDPLPPPLHRGLSAAR